MGYVFISYSRVDTALALEVRTELQAAGIQVRLDTSDLSAGQPWRPAIDRLIRESTAVLVVVTDNALASEEVTYEWAFALGVGVPVVPVLFRHPLGSRNSKLLTELDHVDFTDPLEKPWAHLISELAGYDPNLPLRKALEKVLQRGHQLENDGVFRHNRPLQHVVVRALGEVERELASAGADLTYEVPATQYPEFLIALQREVNAKVRAIALIDKEEQFWQQDAGRRIAASAHRDNLRVFVFADRDQFDRTIDTISTYSKQYNVYGISQDKLETRFGPFAKDFSVIEVAGSKMVAYYDEGGVSKVIRFSGEPDEVLIHERRLAEITRAAVRIRPRITSIEALRERIFGTLTQYSREPVEMSAYIAIDDYDSYEEKHAYYVEMMQAMLDWLDELRRRDPAGGAHAIKALELGAGTGIYTRRLAVQPDVSVTAVEIDVVCHNRLAYNLRNQPTATAISADSRTFGGDGPGGTYSFVFSSFSDHHIRPEDRQRYLDNVRHHLAPGGAFIVGDEFLPDHDPDEVGSWRSALRSYHGHIIDTALSQAADLELAGAVEEARAHRELATLETAALQSGLGRQGDFKVTTTAYEETLTQANFTFERTKIGPLDRDEVGGVYVYVARPKR